MKPGTVAAAHTSRPIVPTHKTLHRIPRRHRHQGAASHFEARLFAPSLFAMPLPGTPPFRVPLLGALLLAALMIAALWPAVTSVSAQQPLAKAEVIIHGRVFRVDVADTPAGQAKGLGGRKHLAADEGMLFVYADKRRHGFWMKGMFIPIDMIWLDNRSVVHIEHEVPPPKPGTDDRALPTYRPPEPGNFVLEIAAGRAREISLKVGDRVAYRFDVR